MKISREVKTGFFAIIILALTVWGFSFLKGKNILKPTREYHVKYSSIDGIIESGNVFYKGYKIGNINGIYFDTKNPELFVVNFLVNKDLRIPVGSTIRAIKPNLIASTKDLELVLYDTNVYYKPGDTLMAALETGMLDMLKPIQDQLQKTMTSLDATLKALEQTLNSETQKHIQEIIASLDASMQSINSMLAPGGSISKTMKNMESVSTEIKNKNQKIGESIDHMANITAALDSSDLQGTIARLDSTLQSANAMLTSINKSEGTAGLLVNDSTLYMNLASATASLDSLLTDLKAHPKRYVQVSVFGGKKNK